MRQAGSLVGGRATRPAPAVICILAIHAGRNEVVSNRRQQLGVPAGHIRTLKDQGESLWRCFSRRGGRPER
jgi:hypothetical protein